MTRADVVGDYLRVGRCSFQGVPQVTVGSRIACMTLGQKWARQSGLCTPTGIPEF